MHLLSGRYINNQDVCAYIDTVFCFESVGVKDFLKVGMVLFLVRMLYIRQMEAVQSIFIRQSHL